MKPSLSWRAAWTIGARLGGDRLHEHASLTAAPGAAGELRDQREGALLGAEVRKAQRGVGVEDDAEADVGKVVALGDHLRADQDAAVGRLEAAQDRTDASVLPPTMSASRRNTGKSTVVEDVR